MIIEFENINIEALRKITKDDAKRLRAIPYKYEADKVHVIVSKIDTNLKSELKFIFDK